VPPVAISGLDRGSTYHYRVVASNATGTTISADATFRSAEAPVVGGLSTNNVKSNSVDLLGEVNPRYGDTTYRFEWGPTATYGNSTPVPDGALGSGNSPVPVSATLEGLSSSVTYHFRLVATNQYGTTASVDQTFGFYPPACPNAQARQETRSNGLPDCRAYELVTPSFAQGAVIMPEGGPNTGLATNPGRLAYTAAYGVFPKETGDPTNLIEDLYVSTRTDTGWRQKYIGLPANQAMDVGGPPEACLENISQGSTRTQRGTQASPSMDRVIDYNRGFPGGHGLLGNYSNAPYVWDTTSGNLLERWPSNLTQVPNGEKFTGIPQASADFSHFVFSSNLVFAPGGEPTNHQIESCPGIGQPADSIYDDDLATGQVALASRKANGDPFQGHVYDISGDGSHILMAEEPEATKVINGPLYLRVDAGRTLEIAPGRKVSYVGSTADGATIYLTSAEQLTTDDHDSSVDLFVWHESDPGSLTRVSFGSGGEAGNSDNCAPAEGWIEKCGVGIIDFKKYAGVTEFALEAGQGGNGTSDNSLAARSGDIYFESPEQLAGAKGEPGQVNLYLYREGTVRYVTTMRPKPLCTILGEATGCSSGPVARMQVTPDGAHMAMITSSHLTGYDSEEHGEMYLFDPGSGRVTCASCPSDGQKPTGEVLASQNGLFLTDDGRAFFSSKDPLVPADTDEIEDVYEYTEGKPQLISAGLGTTIEGNAGIVGRGVVPGLVSVSANGTDVYFGTLDNLVTQDHNGSQIKIYDARTGGGFPAERAAQVCAAADECHGPGSAQPALPPDRTSAELGAPETQKTHKHHKRHKKHKKRHRQSGKKAKQGTAGHGGKGGKRHA
jgi:hypothetical protein